MYICNSLDLMLKMSLIVKIFIMLNSEKCWAISLYIINHENIWNYDWLIIQSPVTNCLKGLWYIYIYIYIY